VLLLDYVPLLGPGETISGKYVERYPAAEARLPATLPSGVDTSCRLVDAGRHDHSGLLEALSRDGRYERERLARGGRCA
jgi:hypothetical protein